MRVAINSRAVVALGDYIKLGLSPEAEFVLEEHKEDLRNGTGIFNLALKAGSIWMKFAEEPKSNLRISLKGATVRLAGKTGVATYSRELDELNVTSLSESFSVRAIGKPVEPVRLGESQSTRLRHGQMLGEIEAVEPHLTEKWKSWSRALLKGIPLKKLDFAVPELVFPEEMITMGPIKSGKSESRNFPMRLEGVSNTFGLKMGVDVSLALPRGLALSTAITDGEKFDTKILHLKADGSEGFPFQEKGHTQGPAGDRPYDRFPNCFREGTRSCHDHNERAGRIIVDSAHGCGYGPICGCRCLGNALVTDKGVPAREAS